MDKGLGRKFAPDPRDTNYPLKAVLPKKATRTYRYWWRDTKRTPLDQGNTGTCVGHGWAHFIVNGPVTAQEADPFAIYDHATTVDEWAGNEGDRSFGTSVRAGAKAVQALHPGRITEYRWAGSLGEIVTCLLEVGPVVVGTVWTESMSSPSPDGFIHPNGDVVGGHCYLLDGVSTGAKKLRILNSWGQWGQRGGAWIEFEDMERLLSADGEACIAIESHG